jgi:hypothetical protein
VSAVALGVKRPALCSPSCGTIVVTVFRPGWRSIGGGRGLEHERPLKKPEPFGKQQCELMRESFLRQPLRRL